MKVLTSITMLILSFAQVTNASTMQVNDNSAESQLCLDAISGEKSLQQIAKQLKVNTAELDRAISCNGMVISKFVKKHTTKLTEANYVLTENQNQLKVMNASKDAKLCAIAATGDVAKLKSVSRLYNMNAKDFIKHSSCNNLPVIDFVAEFGGEQATNKLKTII